MKLHRIVPSWVRMNPIEFCCDDVISDVISGKIALCACKHGNSSKSYPISMKLHRIVPSWVRMNPIEFCCDDVISDVIFGKIAL